MKVGDRIKFVEEKQKYTVRAIGERYAICTKPFNLKKTVLYTIIDFEKNIRGTESLIFCMGAETDEQCIEMLHRLETGVSEISFRNRISLRIEKIL